MTPTHNSPRLLVVIVSLLLGTGPLQTAHAQEPESATEKAFTDARQLYDDGKPAEALTAFQQFESQHKLSATIPQAIYFQGWCWIGLHKYPEAIDTFARLVKAYPTAPLIPEATLKEAECYRELKNYPKAVVVYRQFETQYPNHAMMPQAMLGEAWTLFQQNDLKTAREIVEKVRAQFANDATAFLNSQFLLGQILTTEKNYDAANEVYQQIATSDSPRATDALFLQAETLFGSGQFQEALNHFQKFAAANKDPQLLETADFRIAGCYYGLHDFAQARDNFRTFLQRHPNGKLVPDALFHLGRSYFEISQKATDPKVVQANLANAVKNYELFRAKFPNSELQTEVTFQLGYLYAYLGAQDVDQNGKPTATANFEKAIASFQEFVNRWPDNHLVPEALYQIARNQFAQSKFDAAITAYQQLIDKYPENELAPFAAYEIADCYAGEKKPVERVEALRDFVKRYPNHTRTGNALFAIASQLEGETKPDAAITEYRNLISRAAASANLTEDLRNVAIASELRIASILESRGAIADAVMDCEGFLGKFKDDPIAVRVVITQIAAIYRKAKKSSDAYATLDQLTTQYQQNASVRIAAATSTIDLALGENDTQRANAAALKLLADPEKNHLPSASYIIIGNALLRREQFAQAREAYQKSLALYPNDTRTAPLAQVGLGEASLGLNQFDEAEKSFNQVTTADPQGPTQVDAALGFAKVYLARGKDSGPRDPTNMKAVDLLNKVMASAKGENAGEAAFLLGNYFFNLRDNEKDNRKTALAYYLRVALLISGPHGEEAAFRSGQCHKILGNTEAARSAFQAYLRRFPTGRFIADAQQELAALPASPPQP